MTPTSEFRSVNERIRTRLQHGPSDPGRLDGCRLELQFLAADVSAAIEAELFELTRSASASAA
jgi:hypothetical protein